MRLKNDNMLVVITLSFLAITCLVFAGPNIVDLFAGGGTIVYAADLTEEIIIEVTADYYYSIEKETDFSILAEQN